MPAKSGNEENSIENDTNESGNGALAFVGGLAESDIGVVADPIVYSKDAANNALDGIIAIVLKIPQYQTVRRRATRAFKWDFDFD